MRVFDVVRNGSLRTNFLILVLGTLFIVVISFSAYSLGHHNGAQSLLNSVALDDASTDAIAERIVAQTLSACLKDPQAVTDEQKNVYSDKWDVIAGIHTNLNLLRARQNDVQRACEAMSNESLSKLTNSVKAADERSKVIETVIAEVKTTVSKVKATLCNTDENCSENTIRDELESISSGVKSTKNLLQGKDESPLKHLSSLDETFKEIKKDFLADSKKSAEAIKSSAAYTNMVKNDIRALLTEAMNIRVDVTRSEDGLVIVFEKPLQDNCGDLALFLMPEISGTTATTTDLRDGFFYEVPRSNGTDLPCRIVIRLDNGASDRWNLSKGNKIEGLVVRIKNDDEFMVEIK